MGNTTHRSFQEVAWILTIAPSRLKIGRAGELFFNVKAGDARAVRWTFLAQEFLAESGEHFV
jgi:hypothetical protein